MFGSQLFQRHLFGWPLLHLAVSKGSLMKSNTSAYDDSPPPNHTRGCVKSAESIFVNDQIFDMTHFDDVGRYFRWSKNEFSHSLTLQRTRPSRSGCNRGVPRAGSLSLGRRRFLAPRMNGQFTISSQIPDNLLSNRLTLDAMKLLRHIITIVCLVATFIANAGEQLTTKAKCVVNQPTNAELQLLQGTWEGAVVGDKSHEKITIKITGNSFYFHRDTNFWFDTTITLPAGTDPKQLYATIKGCPPSQASSIGKVVGAIFKIEDGTLTLATGGRDSSPEGTPKSFEATEDKGLTRYELRKVQPHKKNTQPPKSK